jgi:hypothetical protein
MTFVYLWTLYVCLCGINDSGHTCDEYLVLLAKLGLIVEVAGAAPTTLAFPTASVLLQLEIPMTSATLQLEVPMASATSNCPGPVVWVESSDEATRIHHLEAPRHRRPSSCRSPWHRPCRRLHPCWRSCRWHRRSYKWHSVVRTL